MSILFTLAILLAQKVHGTRIACIGDSITFGSGAGEKKWSWVSRLQTSLEPLDYQVLNFGVSGRTMMGTDRYYQNEEEWNEVLSSRSDIILIGLGTNDAKEKYWNDDANNVYISTYLEMINTIRNTVVPQSGNALLIICLVPILQLRSKGDWPDATIINQKLPVLIDQVVQQARAINNNTIIIDLQPGFQLSLDEEEENDENFLANPTLYDDAIHPNSAGHLIIAQQILAAMQNYLQLDQLYIPYTPTISPSSYRPTYVPTLSPMRLDTGTEPTARPILSPSFGSRVKVEPTSMPFPTVEQQQGVDKQEQELRNNTEITLSPSSYSCTDSTSWFKKGDTAKTCEWVAGISDRRRCGVKGEDGLRAYERCFASCNTCPRTCDSEDSTVWSRSGDTNKNCDWTSSFYRSRCSRASENGVFAFEACPYACRVCTYCEDDPDWYLLNNREKDCSWVATQRNRCTKYGRTSNDDVKLALAACPNACRICTNTGDCSDDPAWVKNNEEDSSKNCDWVADAPYAPEIGGTARCLIKGTNSNGESTFAFESCRTTCATC